MNHQNINNNIYNQGKRKTIRRTTFLIVSGLAILLALSALTIALGATIFTQQAKKPGPITSVAQAHSHNNLSSPTVSPALSPTAVPVSGLTPRPEPITPFPSSLQQQIATLQSKDRYIARGNTSLPEVALSFDDGPNPPYTQQILSILQHYGIKATFFSIGRQAQAYPDLLRREHQAGHFIGNHTWSHPDLPHLSASDIRNQLTTTEDAIEHATGIRPTYFRPPYGDINPTVLTTANSLALTVVLWSVDPRDWSRPGTQAIISRVLSQVGNGSIILMHDGGGDRSQTVAALPTIIESLQKRGFRFVPLPQLIDHLHQKALSETSGQTETLDSAPTPRQFIWTRRWLADLRVRAATM
ncbi:polysaccharide deacetylase family protein [Ktedonosporobacter rubrisoli]|uniref:Polysaccharide deacetylase family protein n=1 Tax=Ktedonosporobacter rubrisoli TaxID=2509675 RepID=A0A4P6K5I4_KTERU|nr:polysaccharide deacetylase family protein [Ktedonosporobacter rubrisoli]QBD83223.1 polysaccharide deacetylase family protein [Ktedonosporobacter rubrisoli]